MWVGEVEEAKAGCQAQGGRHVDKGPLPVDRHSGDVLGQGPLRRTEREEANNREDEQCRKPDDYFGNIFPTSKCLVEREEGEGCAD